MSDFNSLIGECEKYTAEYDVLARQHNEATHGADNASTEEEKQKLRKKMDEINKKMNIAHTKEKEARRKLDILMKNKG